MHSFMPGGLGRMDGIDALIHITRLPRDGHTGIAEQEQQKNRTKSHCFEFRILDIDKGLPRLFDSSVNGQCGMIL